MKLKTVVATISLLTAAAAVTASADSLAALNAKVDALQKQVSSLNSGSSSSAAGNLVRFNAAASEMMLNNQGGVNRELGLLKARQKGTVANGTVTLGGQAQMDAIYSHVNQAANAKYSNVQSNSTGNKNASHLVVSHLDLDAIAAVNSWTTVYADFGVANIGNKSTTASTGVQLNQGYLLLGNLSQSPIYGFMGKKSLDFGSFQTVNIYFAPMNRELFGSAVGNQVGVGYDSHGFNTTLTVMNGKQMSQNWNVPFSGATTQTFSTTNPSQIGTDTNNANQINNFALNATYGMNSNGVDWNVGAGYLNGTAFTANNSDGTAKSSSRNGAWDLNANVSVAKFTVLAEYTATTKRTVIGTGAAKKLSAWNLGGMYSFPLMGKKSDVSLSYSAAKYDNTNSQWTAGFRNETFKNVWMGLEYNYAKTQVSTANDAKVSSLVFDVRTFF